MFSKNRHLYCQRMAMAVCLCAVAIGSIDARAEGWWRGIKRKLDRKLVNAVEFVDGEWRCSSLTANFSISMTKKDGESWDIALVGEAPDPTGRLTVYRDSGELVDDEGMKIRRDNYEPTNVPFFEGKGITLKRGDVIQIRLVDYDDKWEVDDPIGLARITVDGRIVSGGSSNGLFSVTIMCKR